jgi:hypothetical protein
MRTEFNKLVRTLLQNTNRVALRGIYPLTTALIHRLTK